MMPKIIWHLPEGRDDLLPRRATVGAMAYDLVAPHAINVPKSYPGFGVGSILINTQITATLPEGYGVVFRSRSGLASKKRITVEAGEIDSDYRGPWMVLLYNHSDEYYTIEAGDRIAQARIVKIEELEEEISYKNPDLNETARGEKGFGSTGK